jgi:hypothetical protein
MKEAADVKRAGETVEALKEALADLDAQIAADADAVAARYAPDAPLERVLVKPKRGDIEVKLVALGWMPDA